MDRGISESGAVAGVEVSVKAKGQLAANSTSETKINTHHILSSSGLQGETEGKGQDNVGI